MTDLILNKFHYCPVVQVILLICGTFLSYIIAYSKGDVSLYLPFISETGAYSPEKCIFSLSLILGSFLGSFIIFCYYTVMRQNEQNTDTVFLYLNTGTLYIGMLSMFGLAGVAAFPMSTVFWCHLMFAAIYFVGNGVYLILISLMTYKVEGVSPKFILRACLSVSIMIFLFLIVILFPMSLVKWHEHNDFIPALKTPDKKGFTLLLLSSILEWSIVIIILIFTLSLITELKKFTIQVTAAEPTKSTTVVESPAAEPN